MGQEGSKEGGANAPGAGASNAWIRSAGLGSASGVSATVGAGGRGNMMIGGGTAKSGNRAGGAGGANGGGGGGGGVGGGGNNSITGHPDDRSDSSLFSNNPLATASVIDSSRNKYVPFQSSAPNSVAGSDINSRSSLGSRFSKNNKSGTTSPANGSQAGSVAGGNNSGNLGATANNSNSNNNNTNGGTGAVSDANSVPVNGGAAGDNASVQPVGSPLTGLGAGGAKGIQQLPPFGFTSAIGVSGWSNLNDLSLQDEIEDFLPDEVKAELNRDQQAHPQEYENFSPNSRASGASGSPINSTNNNHNGKFSVTNTVAAKKKFGAGLSSSAAHCRNPQNLVHVSVLSTPKQMVLSAMQPLASRDPTFDLETAGGAADKSTNATPHHSFFPPKSDTGASPAPFPIELRKRFEAASRIRYAVPTNYSMASVGSQPRAIRCVCSTGDGAQYLVVAMDTSLARLIEPGQSVGSSLLDFRGMMDEIIAATVARDGRYVVLSAKDGAVTSWDLTNGKKVRDLSVTTPVRAIGISDDGELVAGTTGEDSIAVWETKSGDTLSNCCIHSSPPTAVTISRRGNLAASGTIGGEVCIWQCPSGSVTFRFVANHKAIRSLSFSADGSRLMAVDAESVRIWDTFTGELVVSRYTNDSIALGDEEPIQVKNGSFAQSYQSVHRKYHGDGGNANNNNNNHHNNGGSPSSNNNSPMIGGGGGGGGLSNAQINQLNQNSSFGALPQQEDQNTAPPTTIGGGSRGPRTVPTDPMENVFMLRSAGPCFTCGSFAACNVAVVGTNTGLVMLIEPNTGTELLALECRTAVRSVSPAWQGDILYCGDNSGNVYKLKLTFSSKAIQDFNVGLKTSNGRDSKRANMD